MVLLDEGEKARNGKVMGSPLPDEAAREN